MNLSSKHHFRVLWVEDSEDDVFLFTQHLQKEGIEIEHSQVLDRKEFEEELGDGDWDIILIDFHVSDFSPLDAVEVLRVAGFDIPCIVLSGVLEMFSTVEMMKLGISDFVSKDNPVRLGSAIQREVRDAEMRRERLRAFAQLEISNNKQEETLKRLREAQSEAGKQERLRLMGEISFGISHEFNNSLMKMLGIHSLMVADLDKGISLDAHRNSLDLFGAAITDASAVAKRLSSFYSDNLSSEVELIRVNPLLNSMLSDAHKYWEGRSEERGIEVVTDFAEGIGSIQANGRDLIDGFSNILHNAADAMPEGGTIQIRSFEDKGRAAIEISDNGCGMDDALLKRCMEPFYSTKGQFGTGLGMSLTENIVQRFGGSISFQSELSVGTRVMLSFPIAEGESNTSPIDFAPVEIDASKEVSLNILIAEDEPVVAMIVEEYLAMAGHTVEATHTGGDAVKAFNEGSFDLVITDRSMPGLSGDEVALHVKERSPDTPVFLMTGHGDIMISRGQIPNGIDRVLSKPIDRHSLNQAIQDGLAR